MAKQKRPSSQPRQPAPGLRLVDSPPPRLSGFALLGIDEKEGQELKELIRSINEKSQRKRQADRDDGELPPAA